MDNTSYAMEERSQQSGHLPSAPGQYKTTVHQPTGGNIQPHMMPYNSANIQQPQGYTVIAVPPGAVARNHVNDYIFLSIFSCFCCFWPVGIIAVIMSIMVCSSRQEGDLQGAKTYSKWAKYLSIAAIITGMIVCVTVILFAVVAGAKSRR